MKNHVSNECLNCLADTNNPKFCSRSCSAKYNNHITPKRKRQRWYCPICTKAKARAKDARFAGCGECWRKSEEERVGNMTLGDAINENGRLKDRYNTVRYHGRKLSNLHDRCQVCGYSTFVQVCHIKAINSFPPDTLVSAINHPSNIAILCPNHHYELDRGVIDPKDIPER